MFDNNPSFLINSYSMDSFEFYNKVFTTVTYYDKNIEYVFHDNINKKNVNLEDYLKHLVEKNEMNRFMNILAFILPHKNLELIFTLCAFLFSKDNNLYIFYILNFYSNDDKYKDFRLALSYNFLWYFSSRSNEDLDIKYTTSKKMRTEYHYIKDKSSIERYIFLNFIFSEKLFLNDFLQIYSVFEKNKIKRNLVLIHKFNFVKNVYFQIKKELKEKNMFLGDFEFPKDIYLQMINYYI